MTDAFISRYGHQDIFKLRPSLRGRFTMLDKALYERALAKHLLDEVKRRDPADEGATVVE